MDSNQFIKWRPVVLLEKFDHDQAAWVSGKTGLLEPNGDTMSKFVKPYETMQFAGNLLTTAGLDKLTKLITGQGGATALNLATSRVGVGDLATAEAVGNTTLASTGQFFRTNDTGGPAYPTQANGLITMKASFADTEANFVWACWGIDSGTTNTNAVVAPLINRKVQAMGTKTSGIWALTVTLTFS